MSRKGLPPGYGVPVPTPTLDDPLWAFRTTRPGSYRTIPMRLIQILAEHRDVTLIEAMRLPARSLFDLKPRRVAAVQGMSKNVLVKVAEILERHGKVPRRWKSKLLSESLASDEEERHWAKTHAAARRKKLRAVMDELTDDERRKLKEIFGDEIERQES